MTLSLTADTIRSLAVNRAVVAEFPFLAAYALKPSGCGGCGGMTGEDPAKGAKAVAALPLARKARFKALLGADRVVVNVVTAGRQLTTEF